MVGSRPKMQWKSLAVTMPWKLYVQRNSWKFPRLATVIVAGVDVPIGDRRDHFNLKLEDQSNINNLFRVVELGGTEYPYQADDGTCTVYSATEIAQIYVAAQTLITGQTAYHNALKSYVNAMTDAEEIAVVQYGMDLPEPYAAALSEKMAVAQAQMEAIMQKLGGAA